MIITPLEKLELQNLKPERIQDGKNYRRNNRWIETLRDELSEPRQRNGQGDGEGRPGLGDSTQGADPGPDPECLPRTHPGQELLAQTCGHPRGRPIHERPLGSREGFAEPASSVSDQRRTEGPDPVIEIRDFIRPEDRRARTETTPSGEQGTSPDQGGPERTVQPDEVQGGPGERPKVINLNGTKFARSEGGRTYRPIDIIV